MKARTYDGAQAGVCQKGAGKPIHMLVVTNQSNRPIRNLAAQIEVFGGISPGKKLADVVGRIEQVHIGSIATDNVFVKVARSSRQGMLDVGENTAFAWSFDVETYPRVEFTIRFTDDHDLEWQVGPDLRPRKPPVRDW